MVLSLGPGPWGLLPTLLLDCLSGESSRLAFSSCYLRASKSRRLPAAGCQPDLRCVTSLRRLDQEPQAGPRRLPAMVGSRCGFQREPLLPPRNPCWARRRYNRLDTLAHCKPPPQAMLLSLLQSFLYLHRATMTTRRFSLVGVVLAAVLLLTAQASVVVLDERAVNCKVVTGALGALKGLGAPATAFCSAYLHVPATAVTTTTSTQAAR